MLIHNKVGYTRKKQRRQLEREKLAKQHKTICKTSKIGIMSFNRIMRLFKG